MTETNPYAPPKVAEPESTSVLYWQCYGERVMAKNGAILPKVDLETGAAEGEMTAVSRTYQPTGAGMLLRSAMWVVVYTIAKNTLQINGAWMLWAIVGGSILVSWIVRIRGGGGGAITIWEFREAARESRRSGRRRWKTALLILSFSLMLLGPVLLPTGDPRAITALLTGAGLMVVRLIWSIIDRPKTRLESAPRGWLRINKVHPEAMVKLRKIEAEELAKNATVESHRRRRVFTTFYYKYPLQALLGEGLKNPFTVFLIAAMKLLRSKRLERETFDFTEALEIREDEAHEKLRERIQNWRATHPDWAVLLVERLPSPAGDLMLESAILMSPGLEHALCLHHSWLEQKATPGTGEFAFLTWVRPEKLICTTHMALLPIERKDVDTARVRGGEDEVFRAHLARCASHETDSAITPEQVRERFHREKEDLAQLLQNAGLRGPVRQVDQRQRTN